MDKVQTMETVMEIVIHHKTQVMDLKINMKKLVILLA